MHVRTKFALALVFLALGALSIVGGISSYAAAPGYGNLWRNVTESSLPGGYREIVPARYRTSAVDERALRALLTSAPQESATSVRDSKTVLQLPMPDGTSSRFRIVQSPIMEPGLAAKYPEFKTYLGQGIDDPTATTRFDLTSKGLRAIVLSASGTVYIDPYTTRSTGYYISYYKQDYTRADGADLLKHFHNFDSAPSQPAGKASSPEAPPTGANLRVYRLAMAATGEYTQFHGGTKASAMAEIVTLVNRVTAVYEREVAVRLVLINNNDAIVYTDAATDPYNDDLLADNIANTNQVIGVANYDVGHLLHVGSGGVGYVGAACVANIKAGGYSGGPEPKGDAYYIDLVAHEMGHQLGAPHTYNGSTGSCNQGRSDADAWEPGSGSTIMAYAGTCGAENLQQRTDEYFHSGSYDDITNYVAGPEGSSCGTLVATGNTPPVIGALQNYVIPANSYFVLTGSATDANGDTLTYNWEELDTGATSPPHGDDGSRPIFRSFPPTTSPTRYFPRLSDILTKNDGAPTFGEWLPTTNRTLKMRFTARDNRANGGGVNYGEVNVQVVAAQGPFRVTAPNTAVTWPQASQQTVTWNVANTTQAPVSCANVNILLSTDGGQTFGTNLATNTPNDGSEQVTAPNVDTSTARVQVICANNIFFDISNTNFTIGTAAPPPDTPVPSATPTQSANEEEFVAEAVAPGATVTTDREGNGDGATGDDWVETSLRSPNAGNVAITEGRISYDPPDGEGSPAGAGGSQPPNTYFAQQVTIGAPAASAASPLEITFFIDASAIPEGQDHLTIDVYKDDLFVPDCSDDSGIASPDPCVSSHELFSGGDAEITVLTSTGGRWNFEEGDEYANCEVSFTDVGTSSAFYEFIVCLACRDVLGGYADGTYRPSNPVTRGQISKIVANSIGLSEEVTGQTFEDVKPTGQEGASPFYEFIELLTRAGHMGGYACQDPDTNPGTDIPCVAPDNRPYFRPGANATRGQLSKIVSNAVGLNDTPTGQTFTDVPDDSPFYVWIQRFASRGYIGGYPCGGTNPETGEAEPCDDQDRPYFRPNNTVTRGQTAKIVANAVFPDCAIPD